MKKPENFNAGATVKDVSSTAALSAAISNNFSTARVQETPVAQAQQEQKPEPRRDTKEKFLVSMSKGERSVFKAFCAMQNVSMNHFVMCAMDYFKEDLENGKVTISPHSYKRKDV